MGPTSKGREKGGRVKREGRGGEGKKGKEKEGRGREWRVKMCCPMSNKLSPPMMVFTHKPLEKLNTHKQTINVHCNYILDL